MNQRTLAFSPLAFVLIAPIAAARAQAGGPPLPLVRQGDVVAGIGAVTSLGDRVAVDDSGGWLVQATSGTDTAVLQDGDVARRVGDSVAAPAGATIAALRSFAVNGAGEVVWLLDLSTGTTGLYSGSALTLQTGSTVLNTNGEWSAFTTYAAFRHARPSDNGQILLLGSTTTFLIPTDFISVVDVDGAGNATGESVRFVPSAGTGFTNSVPVRPDAAALDATGRSNSLIRTTDNFGGPTTDHLAQATACCGTWTTSLSSGQTAGATGHVIREFFDAGMDNNSTGGWVVKVRADSVPGGATSVRILDNTGGSTTQRFAEGDALAAVAPWILESIPIDAPIHLTDAGAILWYGDWNDPDTTRDSGLFLDDVLLVQEGVTTVEGVVLEALHPAGLAMSPNGRYVVFRGRLAGGVEGAFRIAPGIPVTSFCSGDGSATPCPCGNAGQAGKGCDNSFATGGALLASSGFPSVAADDLVLSASGMPANATALYFQGETRQNGGLGLVFGDGLRCAGGVVIRLGTKTSVAGASSFGAGVGTDPLISVRGLVPAGGATRTYQVWYRNAAEFCTPSAFNLTNGLQVVWSA